MQNKKALIRRLASIAGLALTVSLAAVLFTLGLAVRNDRERAEALQRTRTRAAEQARSDLAAMAEQIRSLPVDPTAVGEIESAYLAHLPEGRRCVWAVDVDGELLFGVPREDFARLQQLWESHRELLQAEGGFVDRLDFYRLLIDADELGVADRLRELEDPSAVARLRQDAAAAMRRHWIALSTPLQDANGGALGNLYMKLEQPRDGGSDFPIEPVLGGLGGVSAASFAFLWFLLPTWVFVDARERGMRRAVLWSFLVLSSLLLGLVVYLVARPEQPGALQCPGCGKEVDGGSFCPHCGHDLAGAFCGACRYPLRPEWAFCPSCRTEIPRPAADAVA